MRREPPPSNKLHKMKIFRELYSQAAKVRALQKDYDRLREPDILKRLIGAERGLDAILEKIGKRELRIAGALANLAYSSQCIGAYLGEIEHLIPGDGMAAHKEMKAIVRFGLKKLGE